LTDSAPLTMVMRSGDWVPKWNDPGAMTPTVARRPLRSKPMLWT
jgi:hypothetical protein